MTESEWLKLILPALGVTILGMAGYIVMIHKDKATEAAKYASDIRDLAVKMMEAIIRNTASLEAHTKATDRLNDRKGR